MCGLKKAAAIIIVAVLALSMASCGKLDDLLSGWKDEFGDLIDQIEAETTTGDNTSSGGAYNFTSKDVNGNVVKLSDYPDARVVMINFWEPWCGPCLGEMPDLAKLYDRYKDQGLLIVGVFSSADMDDDVREIISENGIKYPVVRQMGELASFRAQYVPTTIFTDGSGNLISSEPIVGAKSFSEWESIIKLYLD